MWKKFIIRFFGSEKNEAAAIPPTVRGVQLTFKWE
jgi:hypothetical protein